MSNPSDTDIAWLAGLLEGEGSFCYAAPSPRPGHTCRGRISVQLQMTDQDVVQRAAGLMGCACRPGGTRVAHDGCTRKAMWRTYLSGAPAVRTMRLVRPYMGQRRGAKIDELLALENLSHHPRKKEAPAS